MLATPGIRIVALIAATTVAACGTPARGVDEPTASPATDQDRRIAELDARCQAGEMDGCLELGLLLWDEGWGASTQAGDEKARTALEMACEAGSLEGCAYLGEMVYDGVGGMQDAQQALALYTKACEGKEGHGCFRQGELSLGDDDETARALLGQGCEAGCPHACSALAQLVWTGEGGPEDETQALELWQGACAQGVPEACDALEKLEKHDCGEEEEGAKCAQH